MELYHQILAQYFASSHRFENLIDAPSIVEGICYQALHTIREILKDSAQTDEECFHKIEEIVQLLERIGSDAGPRHDYG